jgi:hypothetical protein
LRIAHNEAAAIEHELGALRDGRWGRDLRGLARLTDGLIRLLSLAAACARHDRTSAQQGVKVSHDDCSPRRWQKLASVCKTRMIARQHQ